MLSIMLHYNEKSRKTPYCNRYWFCENLKRGKRTPKEKRIKHKEWNNSIDCAKECLDNPQRSKKNNNNYNTNYEKNHGFFGGASLQVCTNLDSLLFVFGTLSNYKIGNSFNNRFLLFPFSLFLISTNENKIPVTTIFTWIKRTPPKIKKPKWTVPSNTTSSKQGWSPVSERFSILLASHSSLLQFSSIHSIVFVI